MSVFENRVLSKSFGFMRVEVTGEWKRLHNAEFYDLYSTGVIKSGKMRYVVNVVRFRVGEMCIWFWRERLESLGLNEIIILKSMGAWTRLIWLRIGRSGEPL